MAHHNAPAPADMLRYCFVVIICCIVISEMMLNTYSNYTRSYIAGTSTRSTDVVFIYCYGGLHILMMRLHKCLGGDRAKQGLYLSLGRQCQEHPYQPSGHPINSPGCHDVVPSSTVCNRLVVSSGTLVGPASPGWMMMMMPRE